MTTLLAKAFEQATMLPDIEQNALANWLLDELAAEREWAKSFSESEYVLEKLVYEAIQSNRQAKTTPLDLDRL
jgi:hypothetical protein